MNNFQNGTQSASTNGNANAGANPSAVIQDAKQRLWVREQEVNALKIQNRHLLAKLEDAEKKARPDPITSEQITQEVHKNLQPVITQVERSLASSFEMISGTLKGIYQQSHRAQEVIEEMTAHVKTVESRMQEQRKEDQLYFQEKIFSTIATFCDRIERQVEQRLKALSAIDVMTTKQNELLGDVEALRSTLLEMQTQSRNSEEMARDGLRQMQNQRNDFKLLRAEVQNELQVISQNTGEMPEAVIHFIEGQINAQTRSIESMVRDAKNASIDAVRDAKNASVGAIREMESNHVENSVPRAVSPSENAPAGASSMNPYAMNTQPNFARSTVQSASRGNDSHFVDAAPSSESTNENENHHSVAPASEADEVHDIRSAIAAGEIEASNEDLGLVLELLKTQKEESKGSAKKAGGFLKRVLSKNESKPKNTPEVSDVTELRLE